MIENKVIYMNVSQNCRLCAQQGLTLVELLVVVTIFVAMTSIALPNLQGFLMKSRLTTTGTALQAHFNLARGVSLEKGRIVICKSDNAEAIAPVCSATPSNSSNRGWAAGWIMYQDVNRNGIFDAGEALIQVQGPLLTAATQGSLIPNPDTQAMTWDAGTIVGAAPTFEVAAPSGHTSYTRYICLTTGARAMISKTNLCN